MSAAGTPVPHRPRRRRALASAWRWTVSQEGAPADAAALEARLRAIAGSQDILLPPEADLPEILARMPFSGGLPPEWLPVLATLLLPLLSPDPAPRSAPR